MTPTENDCASDLRGTSHDGAISSMQGPIAVPRTNGELLFDAPWQSRAFGMAVSLSKAGVFPWDAFRRELARAIAEQGQLGVAGYYHRWLDALEMVLLERKVIDPNALHQREEEYRIFARTEVF